MDGKHTVDAIQTYQPTWTDYKLKKMILEETEKKESQFTQTEE